MFAAATISPACPVALSGATPTLALGLPESPVAAVLLLLALLLVTYALVTAFIKVGVPSPSQPYAEGDGDEESAAGDEPYTAEAPDTPDPDWPTETVPRDEDLEAGEASAASYSEPGYEEPEVVREPFSIETVRVRDRYLTLGDTASVVMAAFRPGEGETVPLVERNAAGQARYVSRTYRVGRRVMTLVLERDSSDDPLRLVRIEVGQ